MAETKLETMKSDLTKCKNTYGDLSAFFSWLNQSMTTIIGPGSKRETLSAAETCAERHRRVNWRANKDYKDSDGRRMKYDRNTNDEDAYREGLRSKNTGRNGEETAYVRIPGRYNRMARDSRHRSASINRDVSPDSRKHGTSIEMNKWRAS